MNAMPRTEVLRRQGLIESGFAVLTAVMLFMGSSGPIATALVGAMAVWMAVRGRKMLMEAVPLTDAERTELGRMKAGSRHVREMLALLERAGQEPVRFDLERCRRLARLESLIDGQA
jgi:hypothetical protein